MGARIDGSLSGHSGLIRTDGYLAGEWVLSATRDVFDVFNPDTQQVVARVANFSADELDTFVCAAVEAFHSWRRSTAAQRASVLSDWADMVLAHEDALAHIMTLEQGKPLSESVGEVRYAASYLNWFAEEARRIYGDVIPAPLPDRTITATKEPVGVCVAITPWNFPLAMITRKAAPALAAGCSMIAKPSEETPLSALALAELASRAGVPNGVFSVFPTTHSAAFGDAVMADKRVRKVSFTGSTRVGQILGNQSGKTIKRLSLELGGNAPLLVFDDADIDAAVEGTMASKFRNAGQTCVCTNRILVQDPIRATFEKRLCERVADLKVGSGLDAAVAIGPLINDAAVSKVETLVSAARDNGACVLAGGVRHQTGCQFYSPTVVSCPHTDFDILREEIFGPVAVIASFRSEEEAIRLANETEAGLAAYVFTRNASRIMRVSRALEYGMVGVNTGLISSEVIPFGGVKYSGYGREGSKYGIDDYTDIRTVVVQH